MQEGMKMIHFEMFYIILLMQRAIGPAALIVTFDHKLYQLRHIIQRAIGPAVSFGQSRTNVLYFLGDIGT